MSALFVGVIFILVIIAVVVGVAALAASSYRSGSAQPVAPTAPATPMPSREERQDILKKLAQGDISKAEAEDRLAQLGTPVPSDMVAPVPRRGSGLGCLIALLVGLILIPLILFVMHFSVGFQHRSSSSMRQRAMERTYEHSQPGVATSVRAPKILVRDGDKIIITEEKR